MDEKSTWNPTRRTIDKVSWSAKIFIRWAQRKFRQTMIFFKDFFPSKTNFYRLVVGQIPG
jgi:hypothetical protein